MLLKKTIFGIAIGLCLTSIFVPVYAAEIQAKAAPVADDIQGYVYEYKYTTIAGVKYRRLWNVTKGEWAEPYWTAVH